MKLTTADIGKVFETRGGWKATVVWVYPSGNLIVVHTVDTEAVWRHSPTGECKSGGPPYDLLPPKETLQGIVSFPGCSGAPIAKVDVDLREGKITAVRLVEDRPPTLEYPVGSKWFTRGGWTAMVLAVEPEQIRVNHYYKESSFEWWHDLKGMMIGDNRSYDLVERIPLGA